MKDYYERPDARRKRNRGCGPFIGLAAVVVLVSLIIWVSMDQSQEQQEEVRVAEMQQAEEKIEDLYLEVAGATDGDHMQQLYELAGKSSEDDSGMKLTRLLFFSRDGMILSSIDPRQVGRKVGGRHHEAYLASRARGAVFEVAESGEICGIRPVYNGEGCQVCHAGKLRIIGVMEACVTDDGSVAGSQGR